MNVQQILTHRQLPSRAGATVGALVLILISSMVALIPQSLTLVGVEILAFGVIVWLLQLWSAHQLIVAQSVSARPMSEIVIGVAMGQTQVIPFLVGAILLLMGQGAGAYWIALGVIAVFAFSVVSTWILLVEILR